MLLLYDEIGRGQLNMQLNESDDEGRGGGGGGGGVTGRRLKAVPQVTCRHQHGRQHGRQRWEMIQMLAAKLTAANKHDKTFGLTA